MEPLKRFGLWLTHSSPLARTPWLSWLSHLAVSIIAASIISWFIGGVFGAPAFGWVLGTWMILAFYLRREIKDARRYLKAHTLRQSQRKEGGATNLEDGIGDALGPLALSIGSTVAWMI